MRFAAGDIVCGSNGQRYRLVTELNEGIHDGYTLWDAITLSFDASFDAFLDGIRILNSREFKKVSLLERLAWEAAGL